MKSYTELTFHIAPFTEDIADALIAELGALNYDGFVYTEDGFKAYINAAEFDASTVEHLDLLQILPDTFQITWDQTEIADQDWNKEWEEHFTPILINDQIMVRTGFHPARPEIPYEIIIEPKMSFGTGHHATTALMLESILDFADEIKDKQVLDMGCGTGILSIMASKAGAAHVTGIDIDEWAYTNTMENLRNNHLQNVSIKIGDASLLEQEKTFDFILANINRNILLQDMHRYVQHLSPNGYLIMSGFYTQDLPLIQEKAAELNLQFHRQKIKDNWVAASFYRPA